MEAKINLNDFVWVSLNCRGWAVLRDYYNKLFNSFPNEQEHVSDSVLRHKGNVEQHFIDGEMKDVLKIQLSEFMNIFGEEMYVGAESVIENNNIWLVL